MPSRTHVCLSCLGDPRHLHKGRIERACITPKVVHTIEALEDAIILEVSTPELHDVVRIEDHYGRPVEAPRTAET